MIAWSEFDQIIIEMIRERSTGAYHTINKILSENIVTFITAKQLVHRFPY